MPLLPTPLRAWRPFVRRLAWRWPGPPAPGRGLALLVDCALILAALLVGLSWISQVSSPTHWRALGLAATGLAVLSLLLWPRPAGSMSLQSESAPAPVSPQARAQRVPQALMPAGPFRWKGLRLLRLQGYLAALVEASARLGQGLGELGPAPIETLTKAAAMLESLTPGAAVWHAAASVRTDDEPAWRMAARMAGGRHEHWDGRGLPHRLHGAQIPLEARLLALAEAYEALTTPRAGKPAWSHEQAQLEILSLSASRFDPHLALAFIACEARFREIARTHRDLAA